MGKDAGGNDLEAGALTAWTPAQQAALYHLHLAKQVEADEDKEYKESVEKEEKEKRGEKEEDKVAPEGVQAGKVVDDLIKTWCPPLHQFLDLFAPPPIALVVLLAMHGIYWWTMPWYLRHLITLPWTYLIPITCTFSAIYTPTNDNRLLWQAYWVELALVEYLELIMFRDTARSLIWWPKIKAILCVALYSVVERQEKRSSSREPSKVVVVYGAVKLIKNFLPELPKDKKQASSREKEKQKAQEDPQEKAKAKAKGK